MVDPKKTVDEAKGHKSTSVAKEHSLSTTASKAPANSQNQANISAFSFGAPPTTTSQAPAFEFILNGGASSTINGFASFASASNRTTGQSNTNRGPASTPVNAATPTLSSKDILHAYVEDVVKLQVKEEVQRLFKEGKLDEQIQVLVREELRKLINTAVKDL